MAMWPREAFQVGPSKAATFDMNQSSLDAAIHSLGCRAATMTTFFHAVVFCRQAAAIVAEVVSDVGHAEHLNAAMIPT